MQVLLVDVRKALADKRGCPYERFYVVYGRKPPMPPVDDMVCA